MKNDFYLQKAIDEFWKDESSEEMVKEFALLGIGSILQDILNELRKMNGGADNGKT